MNKLKSENEIAIAISRMFKQMFGRGPELVMFDVCRDLLIIQISRLLSKGQTLLIEKKPDSPILDQYYRSIVDEIMLPEIQGILERLVGTELKYLTDSIDVKENFILIVFLMEKESGRT